MISSSEFWRLAIESRLFTTQQLENFRHEFAQVKGAAEQGNVKTLLEWLVSQRALSRYQAKILAGGRSGPFFYGDYKVYDRSEQGRWTGMFHAVHVGTGHPVLLQFLTGPVTQDARQWAETAARVQAHTGLRHPFVARVHELVDLVSFKFLALEDLAGCCLAEQLATQQRCDPAEACRLIREAALGLGELHGRQLVHGDPRPRNLWLTDDGHLKLLPDPLHPPAAPRFGAPGGEADLLARADYLAPEFTRPTHQPDRLSDIYALGCVFYQLLSGRPPFPGGDVTDKLQRHAKQPIQPLEPLGVPQPVAQVVAYMMAKNPSVRYQQAGMIAEQLQAFIDPARLNQQPRRVPTLEAYEGALQRKHQIAASASPSSSPSSTGAGGVSLSGAAAGGAAATVTARSGGIAAPQPAVAPSGSVPAGGPHPSGAYVQRDAAPSLEFVPSTPATPTTSATARLKQPRQKYSPAMIGGGLAGVAAVLILLLIVLNIGGGEAESDDVPGDSAAVAENPAGTGPTTTGPAPTGPTNTGTGPQTTPVASVSGSDASPATSSGPQAGAAGEAGGAGEEPVVDAPRQTVVPDDGKLLWASPTSGPPIRLNYFPPGGQVFLHARPADLLASEQGRLVLEALGPTFAESRAAWEAAAGVPLEQVERLLVGLYDNGEQFPRPFYAVWLSQPADAPTLLAGWGNPAEVAQGEARYYKGADHAFFLPGQAGGPTFLMGAEPEIQTAAEFQGAVPPLRRGMEPMLQATDSGRHLTLLGAPSYLSTALFHDGRTFYFGKPTTLRKSLEWFLGDDLHVASLSLHFGEPFYWETRLYSSLNRDTQTLASNLRDRIAEVPTGIERHIVGLNPHPYWRMVAFRFPAMIRSLHRQARIGVEGDQAVINGVLPGPAAHNLVFGGEMVLSAGSAAPLAVATTEEKTGPASIDEVLNLKMDMMFDQTSLEFSMRDLAADINETHRPSFDFGIKIIGDDLKLDGITRNQQIRDFAQQGKTVGEILTALVMKANPITTVQQPSEADQKLIWVVGPDPDNPSRKIVLITTRNAAEAKNYTLPAPFRPST